MWVSVLKKNIIFQALDVDEAQYYNCDFINHCVKSILEELKKGCYRGQSPPVAWEIKVIPDFGRNTYSFQFVREPDFPHVASSSQTYICYTVMFRRKLL